MVETSREQQARVNWLALGLLWPLKTVSAFASGRGLCPHPAFLSASLCGSGLTSQCSESSGSAHKHMLCRRLTL